MGAINENVCINGDEQASISNFLQKEVQAQGRMFYFAFGSNMLHRRVQINNPSMKLIGIAKLDGYRFSFSGYSKIWQGAVANIVPDPDSYVIGVLYTMDSQQLDRLNKQEAGFQLQFVSVYSKGHGCIENVATYMQKDDLLGMPDKRPSVTYKMCCVQGAQEHGISDDYVKSILDFEDNGICGVGPESLKGVLP